MSVVRFGAAILLFALIGLLVYVTMFHQSGESRERAAKATIRAVLVSMFDARDDLHVESLVVGNEIAANRFDFRGAVTSETTSLPLYGEVALTCEALRRDPECWELLVLERDGQPWPLSPMSLKEMEAAELEPGPDSATRPSDEESDVGAQRFLFDESLAPNADLVLPSASGTQEQTAARSSSNAAVSSTEGADKQLFRVTAEIVNGRAGPGTDYEVIAWISPERRLIELEAGEEWGRFRYLDPKESDSEEFWVWLDLVTEAPTEP